MLQAMEDHGDQGQAHQDVGGGEEDGHQVLLLNLILSPVEAGHPDGGQQGEAVVESIQGVDAMVGCNPH